MRNRVLLSLTVLALCSSVQADDFSEVSVKYDPALMSRHGITSEQLDKTPPAFREQFCLRHPAPYITAETSGQKSRDDWQTLIDDTWGGGLATSTKISIFNSFWNQVDQRFACFQDLGLDWDSVKSVCSDELLTGVSRGRFSGMLHHATVALREGHTRAYDQHVTYTTPEPGVPLLMVGQWGDDDHFGAALTPLEDSTLLVYRAAPSHPLGLVPGDIVLGYDGSLWKDLYPQLVEAQLPIGLSSWWGSSEEAFTHSWLMAAGLNWHLFDTIDFVQYATGDTLHLPVSLLEGQYPYVDAREQMDIPGVLKPAGSQAVTWGMVEGTQIGYVYGIMWGLNAETEFYNAVDSLMNHFNPIGIIFDFRTNYGGNMFLAYPALRKLFYTTEWTIGFDVRCEGGDHDDMCPGAMPSYYRIDGDLEGGFRKPIAILSGPGAISSGDQVTLAMSFHPDARTFGKPTSAAFNAPEWPNLYDGFYFVLATADAYFEDNPGHYLTHDYLPVDEPVWLTPDAVAEGRDDVVEAAMAWIYDETGAWFVTDTSIGEAPLEVSFSGLSMLTVNDWTWDFGDGDSAFEQSPVHVYQERGLYDVTLRVETADTVRTHVEHAYIAALADTMFADTCQYDPDSNIVVTVCAANMLPLSRMSIPVEYSGEIDLYLDSFSTAGCRTNYFQVKEYEHYSSSGYRATIELRVSDAIPEEELPPGSGPIVKLYFSPEVGVTLDRETPVVLDGYLTFEPTFVATRATYQPIPVSGLVWYPNCCQGIRGNIDNDPAHVIDITDLVYLVDYMFTDGPEPPCLAEANVDGDFLSQIDIADLIYLVEYMFASGPDPALCW